MRTDIDWPSYRKELDGMTDPTSDDFDLTGTGQIGWLTIPVDALRANLTAELREALADLDSYRAEAPGELHEFAAVSAVMSALMHKGAHIAACARVLAEIASRTYTALGE
jgi:hypothetical protein